MKAVIQKKYGAPDVLQITEIEKPKPEASELLIKVFATTVNRTDCAALRANLFITRLFTGLTKPKKQTTGTDFAGMVEEVGGNVDQFKPGDSVFGFDDLGLSSHAEYLVISDNKAIGILPNNSNFEEAVACIEGFHYALNFINKIQLKKGDQLIVNGATGAIGSAVLQLSNYYGAEITAVCKAEDFELVKSLGAKQVMDYDSQDFTKIEQDFDFVLDAVGKSSFSNCKSLLKEKGIYISSELGKHAENVFLSLFSRFKSGKKVKFPIPFNIKASITLLTKLLEEGKYKPIIDTRYSLDQIEKAFKYVETGKKKGSVVVLMNEDDG